MWLCRSDSESSLTARVKAGEQHLGSKGQKGNLHWSTHRDCASRKCQDQICLQSNFYALTVQAVLRISENQQCSVGSLLLYCSKIMLSLLVRLCVWNIPYFEKWTPQLKKLPGLSHSTSFNQCLRGLKPDKTCQICTGFHWFHKYQKIHSRDIVLVWHKLWN